MLENEQMTDPRAASAPAPRRQGADIRPTGNYILVKPDTPEQRTEGGLYLPDQSRPRPFQGYVLAVGPGLVSQYTGQTIALKVRKGDRVIFVHRSGAHLVDKQVLGENILMPETDVVAVLGE